MMRTLGPMMPVLALALALTATPTPAQQSGGDVPPPPESPTVFAPPVRDGEFLARKKKDNEARTAKEEETIAAFRAAYEAHGRPRMVLYWNRELGDTVSEWYTNDRVVVSGGSAFTTEGDTAWRTSGGGETVIERQQRAANPTQRRPHYNETWEWDFIQGFLAPMLDAKAVVLDRAAITRLTAANQPAGPLASREQVVEATALQGMADLMIEVLLTGSDRSTTRYELHARVLDTRTGQILANVNSRSMSGWGRPADFLASEHGLERIDDDDEMVGPIADKKYEASSHGFAKKRRAPKPRTVARQLSYNVMNGLLTAWQP